LQVISDVQNFLNPMSWNI